MRGDAPFRELPAPRARSRATSADRSRLSVSMTRTAGVGSGRGGALSPSCTTTSVSSPRAVKGAPVSQAPVRSSAWIPTSMTLTLARPPGEGQGAGRSIVSLRCSKDPARQNERADRQNQPQPDDEGCAGPADGLPVAQRFVGPRATLRQDGRGDQTTNEQDPEREEDQIVQVAEDGDKIRDQI